MNLMTSPPQLVGFSFMPESPRWLMAKGRTAEAFATLTKMRGSEEEARKEVEEIARTVEEEKGIGGKNTFALLNKVSWTSYPRP
jgi:hypothetical protein